MYGKKGGNKNEDEQGESGKHRFHTLADSSFTGVLHEKTVEMDKMTAADTSRKAYQEIKESGKEKSQLRQVLDALRKSEILPTANELNQDHLELDIPNGRVHARLKKLEEKDLVIEVGKRPDKYTGRVAKTWMPKKKEVKKVDE